jgi:hypothetical protein
MTPFNHSLPSFFGGVKLAMSNFSFVRRLRENKKKPLKKYFSYRLIECSRNEGAGLCG